MKNKSVVILLSLTCCLLFAGGCTHKTDKNSSEEKILKASFLLDQRDYDGAIGEFEEINASDPSNETAKIKLFHAYAGAGGFESLRIVDVLKSAESKISEIKDKESSKLKIKFEKSATIIADNALNDLDLLLEKVPTLNKKQRINLNKAIKLYDELGLKLETAGNYNNFKWGTLHAFRFIVSFKEIVQEVKKSKADDGNYNLKTIEKIVLSHSNEMGSDLFQVVKLYSHSYEKFQAIRTKIENLIAKTIDNKEFKLTLNDLAKNEVEFYETLLRDNSKAYTKIVMTYINVYQEGFKGLKSHKNEIVPSDKEISDTAKRLESLIRLTLRAFTIKEPDAEGALKDLFSYTTKQELYKALIDCINAEELTPLKLFLDLKEGKFQGVVTYAQLLLNNIDEEDVVDEVKNQVHALSAKVNQDILKQELDRTEQAIIIAQEAGDKEIDLLDANIELSLATHQNILNERIQEIDDYLKAPLDELDQALESKIPDEDLEQMDKIIRSVFKTESKR